MVDARKRNEFLDNYNDDRREKIAKRKEQLQIPEASPVVLGLEARPRWWLEKIQLHFFPHQTGHVYTHWHSQCLAVNILAGSS